MMALAAGVGGDGAGTVSPQRRAAFEQVMAQQLAMSGASVKSSAKSMRREMRQSELLQRLPKLTSIDVRGNETLASLGVAVPYLRELSKCCQAWRLCDGVEELGRGVLGRAAHRHARRAVFGGEARVCAHAEQ